MPHKPDIQVQVLHAITKYPRAVTVSPRKCILKSGNGAQKDRCWIEFYNQEPTFSADLEDEIVVSINRAACFRGRIYQKRIDSVDDILSLYAEWDPNREWNRIVSGAFENDTIPEI
ncbi:hypothetical protein GF373_03250, partial [bacterium]|nr:hypothetical protein [bacterium]